PPRSAPPPRTEGRHDAPLATTPAAVAEAVAAAIASGKETVWVPGALRYVMAALRHLPRPAGRRVAANRWRGGTDDHHLTVEHRRDVAPGARRRTGRRTAPARGTFASRRTAAPGPTAAVDEQPPGL